MKRRPAQTGKVAGASPATRTIFWNANRTSEPGFGANECVPSGKWCKSTVFRHSDAGSSKRAGDGYFSFVNVLGRPPRFRIISLLAASNSKVTFPPKS